MLFSDNFEKKSNLQSSPLLFSSSFFLNFEVGTLTIVQLETSVTINYKKIVKRYIETQSDIDLSMNYEESPIVRERKTTH